MIDVLKMKTQLTSSLVHIPACHMVQCLELKDGKAER